MNFENLKTWLKNLGSKLRRIDEQKKIAKILSANNLKPTILSW